MALPDHFEFDLADNATTMWQLLTGHNTEDLTETQRQVDVILDGIPQGTRALEIGAGIGRLMREIDARSRFDKLFGVDSSNSMTMVGKRYPFDCLDTKLELSDGLRLPYADGWFDFVYSFTTFQHMLTRAIVHRNLTETYRVLRPGGVARIQTVASGPDRDPRDTELFDGRVFRDGEEFWREFEQLGFERVAVDVGLTHPEHIWVTATK